MRERERRKTRSEPSRAAHILARTRQPSLNPTEVERLFSLPLRAFLQHHPHPELRQALKLGDEPTEVDPVNTPWSEESGPSDWHTCRDVRWFDRRVRRHTFWDRRNPVRGLTRWVYAGWGGAYMDMDVES